MSHGISLLGSYTLSRLMDNTGGPNFSTGPTSSFTGSGTGGRNIQSVSDFTSDYTVSPLDRTHRLIFNGSVDLPFGKGRRLLGNPQGLGGKILDGAVGGWKAAGIYTWNSGVPLNLSFSNSQSSSTYGGMLNTWGTWATSNHDLGMPGFAGNNSVLTTTEANLSSVTLSRLNSALINNSAVYTLGNVNPVYPGIREPGFFDTDLSLMKNFALGGDGKRFLQLRVEATNAFNQRGFPNYQTEIGQPGFGLLIADPNNSPKQPRTAQISGRIVF
jgi:hypothetical protein